ncbi:hypothetical protein HPB50_012749 [Hyalomma asiaticum]|uniref:Uncharacterized protein n=1 Tax=Hyalomma asiaticum TaxID=266040 RepID=A0ACB7THL2_HYAAI|nr:hypothetical protein HPB50_012749 [Hyalomma asiaticum]
MTQFVPVPSPENAPFVPNNCAAPCRLVNMCEKLTEAFERVVSLSECSSVKDAPNFLTPQRRNPPHGRRCWSSARGNLLEQPVDINSRQVLPLAQLQVSRGALIEAPPQCRTNKGHPAARTVPCRSLVPAQC